MTLTPVAAREHVRVAGRLAELPGVRAAFEYGELSYSKVRAITRVATSETEADLVELARHATGAQLERLVRSYRGVLAVTLEEANQAYEDRYLDWSWDDDGSLSIRGRLSAEDGAAIIEALQSARDHLRAREASKEGASAEAPSEERLEASDDGPGASAEAPTGPAASNADALVLLAESFATAGPAHRTGGERCQVVVHVDAAALNDDASEHRCELHDGPALPPETARRLACDSSLVTILERDGQPLSVGRKTRAIPPALRRALRSRDGGCQFPGCTQRRFVDAHHIRHWARGGETKLTNLLLMCRHHHRLLHEGGYTVERHPGAGVTFRRPDGRAIRRSPAPHTGDRHQLARDHRRSAPGIDLRTCAPRSAGDRLDYDIAIEGLLVRDGLLHGPPGSESAA